MAVDVTLEELTPRLQERIERMVEAGAVEEVRRAFARYPRSRRAGLERDRVQGNPEPTCSGEMTLEEAKEQWLRSTRAYAKRQLTWFRGRRGALVQAGAS
jgi:tRNA dimethylallyltransferase